MKRTIQKQLIKWKKSSTRKPLILMGARQVGKTTELTRFAQTQYENHVYLNFEDQPHLNSLFLNSLKPEEIIKLIELDQNTNMEPGTTLILFDEVQHCPEALNSLKYFNEQKNEYHICAAGSLLGVKLEHVKGFPVGKVDFLDMYPLSFSEFLLAKKENKLLEFLQDTQEIKPVVDLVHEKLTRFYKEYLFVGGMPEAIYAHVNGASFEEVRQIQNSILRAYQLDFAKHAPRDQVMRINQVWDALTAQLSKENKKFVYSVVRQGSRAKDFEVAIQWLKEAGLVLKVTNISKPALPLSAYANFDFFKLYLLDVGLLGALANLSAKSIMLNQDLLHEFKGALTENFVAQSLTYMDSALFYWTSNQSAEIDFIFNRNDSLLPLEVKSGHSSWKRSLQVYQDKYQPKVTIRVSPMNLKQDGLVLNVPLYLVDELPHLIDQKHKV